MHKLTGLSTSSNTLPNRDLIVLDVNTSVSLKYSKIEDLEKYSISGSMKQRYMFYFIMEG